MTRQRDETAAELDDTAASLAAYLVTLQRLLPEPSASGLPQGVIGRHTVAPLPGNAAAFGAATTITEGVRRLEALLRYLLTRHPGRARGGSDGNTALALAAIPKLAAGLTRDDAARTLETLHRFAGIAQSVPDIDEAPRWRLLYADDSAPPGTVLPAQCPYCRCYWLYADADARRVKCGVRDCVDSAGNRPQATMERSGIDGRPRLIWDDGRVEEVR